MEGIIVNFRSARHHQTGNQMIIKVKGYSDKEKAKELVDNLLVIPDNKVLSATDYLSKIIQDIRSATDGFYIKVKKDDKSGN